MTIRSIRYILLFLSVLSLALLVACNDEDCPTCPEPQDCPDCPDPLSPTLENIWPNEDGNAWTYDLTANEFAIDYQVDLENPPPLPTMEDLYIDLQGPAGGELLGTASGLFRFAFDGLTTTDPGVTGQNVIATVFTDPWTKVLDTGIDPSLDPEATLVTDGFELLLQRVAQARPDLRPKIADTYGVIWEPQDRFEKAEIPFGPLFLPGSGGGIGAWKKNDLGIYAYGIWNTDPSWIYLEANLSVGHGFQLQLIPNLASDIFLYGQIFKQGSFTTGGLEFYNCVECMYVIDMGFMDVTDVQGNLLGQVHTWCYGLIVYAPGVGPIFSIERLLHGVLEDPGHMTENIVELIGATREGS